MTENETNITIVAESLLRMRLGNVITTCMADQGYKNYSDLNLSIELKDNWPYDKEYEELSLTLLMEVAKKLNLKLSITDLDLIPEKDNVKEI